MDRKNTLNPVGPCTCKTSPARSEETCHEQKFTSKKPHRTSRIKTTEKEGKQRGALRYRVIAVSGITGTVYNSFGGTSAVIDGLERRPRRRRRSPAHGIIWFNLNNRGCVSEKFVRVKMSSWQETWQQVTDFRLNLINFHSPLYFAVYRDRFYRDGFQAFRFARTLPHLSFRVLDGFG